MTDDSADDGKPEIEIPPILSLEAFEAMWEASKWPEPKPVPDGLLPVAKFDLAFLPKSVAPWVKDVADLMQCPLDFVAIPVTIALASTIGRKVAIRPQRNTDWTEVPTRSGRFHSGARTSKPTSCATKGCRTASKVTSQSIKSSCRPWR
jgi:hypothetical protein